MSNPRVSVVMPVYNQAKFIKPSIESILVQTFKNFELIIVDDKSTDDTLRIIKNIQDSRIRLIEHDRNRGVAATRNTGYCNAKGEFILIADSDDLSHPDRLLKKVTFLEQNPNIDVVSCSYQEIDNQNNYRNIIMFEPENDQIRANWIFNPGIPSFMMFRRKKIECRNLLYHNETYKAAVDYQWYTSLDDDIRLYCIPEVLYYYRRHETQISIDSYSVQQKFADKIRKEQLRKIGVTPTSEEFNLHKILINGSVNEIDEIQFLKILKWCETVKHVNEHVKYFDIDNLNKIMAKKLENLLNGEPIYSIKKNQLLINSELSPYLIRYEEHFNLSTIKQIAERIDKEIIVFGTKKMGYIIKVLFEKVGIHVSYFIDNNIVNRHKQIDGYEVLAPWEVDAYEEKIFIISVISDTRFIIKNQLIKMYRISEENILTLDDLGYGGF